MPKKLSIIIAAFNEEKTIIEILKKVRDTKRNQFEYEVIVVNDGSTDNTYQFLDKNRDLYSKIVNFKKNSGKGFAIKEGLKIASGEYIIFQDGDLEYDPNDLNYFCDLYNKLDPDLIIGSRFRYREYTKSHNFFNFLGNKVITLFFNFMHNSTFTDIYSCYISFKKKFLDISKLKSNGFEQQAEILGILLKKTKKNYEIPINYSGREITEGKKIRFYHFFLVLYQIIKSRF